MKKAAASIFLILFFVNYAKSEWVQTNLDGGYVYGVAATNKTTFATTYNGGLFRSDIKNAEWIYTLGAGYEVRSVQVIGDSIFAAGENGVYLSTNEGEKWINIDDGDFVSYFKSGNIICCSFGFPGGKLSMDNGQSWTSFKIENKVIEHICAAGADRIFAAPLFSGGFFQSNDSGATWEKADLPPPISLVQDILVKGDIVMVAMSGACISRDRGETWNRIDDLKGKSVQAIAYSPAGYFFAATSDSGVYRSSDNGITWSHVGNNLTDAYKIAVNGGGTVFVTTINERSVFRSSDNGESWEPASRGLRCDEDLVLTANSRGEILAGGDLGVFKSDDHGQTWIDVDSALQRKDDLLVRNFAVLDSEIYAVAGNVHGILRSVNHGNDWDTISSSSLSEDFNPLQICITDSGNIVVSTIDNILIMSKDRGKTWAQIGTIGFSDVLYTIRNDILVGNTSGNLLRYNGIGTQWTVIGSLPDGIDDILYSGGFLFAATSGANSGGLYRSSDNGANWIKIDSSIMSQCIKTLFSYDSLLFAGTNFHGIFLSKDYGKTWIDVNGALKNRWVLSEPSSNLWIYSLAVADGYLYASIDGGSVWRRPIDELAAMLPVKKEEYRSFNFDNFKITGSKGGSTKMMEIQLTRPQKVSVKVYGLNGKLKMVLVDKLLAKGKHALPWNTSGLAGGFYVVKMQAGNESFSRIISNM